MTSKISYISKNVSLGKWHSLGRSWPQPVPLFSFNNFVLTAPSLCLCFSPDIRPFYPTTNWTFQLRYVWCRCLNYSLSKAELFILSIHLLLLSSLFESIVPTNTQSFRSEYVVIRSSVGKESACSAGGLGSIPGLGRFPREGNGNPLQYSYLENSTDGGASWATVHGVAKSRTRLSDFTFNMWICIF